MSADIYAVPPQSICITLDGAVCPGARIPLVNDRREHFVDVALGGAC